MLRAKVSKKDSALREFAKKVRMRRYELELTQEELAEKANLHVNYIGGIERGERNVSFEKIIELACALELSPKNLMPD